MWDRAHGVSSRLTRGCFWGIAGTELLMAVMVVEVEVIVLAGLEIAMQDNDVHDDELEQL